MIGVEHNEPAGKGVARPVSEGKGASLQLKRVQNRVVGNATNGKKRDEIGQRLDAGKKKRAAGCNFLGRRLVLRRHAAHGIRDHAIDKLKRIGRAPMVAPARQTRLEQGGVEQLAGKIAEEWSPGTVCAFKPGRKPNDEEPGALGSERRYRAIEPIGMRAPVLLAEGDEARAERTVFDGLWPRLCAREKGRHR